MKIIGKLRWSHTVLNFSGYPNNIVMLDNLNRTYNNIKQNREINMKNELDQKLISLMDRSEFVILANLDLGGYPAIKAMLNMEHEGLKKVWFSTNTSSHRVEMFLKDNRASVYYVDAQSFEGLLLTGTIEIKQDCKSKEKLWRPGFEIYYSKGIDDPDYTVLEFKTVRGNYYHQLTNNSFVIKDEECIWIL